MSDVLSKFRIRSVQPGLTIEDRPYATVTLSPDYEFDGGADGNKIAENRELFGKFTPCGNISITIAQGIVDQFFNNDRPCEVIFRFDEPSPPA